MSRLRRWVAVSCVLVLVAGALLAPLAGGAPSDGVLVPLAPLFGLVPLFVVAVAGAPTSDLLPGSTPRPSRAPPANA